MQFYKIILVAMTALFLVSCQRVMPVYNVDHQPFPAMVENLSQKKLEIAIIEAGSQRGWIITPKSPGQLEAVLTPRRHMAKIEINYDPKGFSIKYLDSQELMFDGTNIHRNYNKWVKTLQQDILRTVSLAANMAS